MPKSGKLRWRNSSLFNDLRPFWNKVGHKQIGVPESCQSACLPLCPPGLTAQVAQHTCHPKRSIWLLPCNIVPIGYFFVSIKMQSRVSSKPSIDDSCYCSPQCQLLLGTCRQLVGRRVWPSPPWDMVVKVLRGTEGRWV